MTEAFITAFIVYFVVIDPIGNSPIFLAMTSHLERTKKTRIALEATFCQRHHAILCFAWFLDITLSEY